WLARRTRTADLLIEGTRSARRWTRRRPLVPARHAQSTAARLLDRAVELPADRLHLIERSARAFHSPSLLPVGYRRTASPPDPAPPPPHALTVVCNACEVRAFPLPSPVRRL